jgi:hypothetical protein
MSAEASAGTAAFERRAEPSARRHISETELMVVPAPRRIGRAPAPPRRARRIVLLVVLGAALIGGVATVIAAGSGAFSAGAYEGY